MRKSNRPSPALLSLAGALLTLLGAGLAPAPAEEKDKDKADKTEKVTLEYRTARDAYAPSKFIAVSDKGASAPLKVAWDLPKPDDKVKKELQDRRKKEFDDLIKKLEEKGINGVEFECEGEWLDRGFRLRLTTVPQLTEAGKKRIKEHE
jgi:hypothetical protein